MSDSDFVAVEALVRVEVEYAWVVNGRVTRIPLGTARMMEEMKAAGHKILTRKHYTLNYETDWTDYE